MEILKWKSEPHTDHRFTINIYNMKRAIVWTVAALLAGGLSVFAQNNRSIEEEINQSQQVTTIMIIEDPEPEIVEEVVPEYIQIAPEHKEEIVDEGSKTVREEIVVKEMPVMPQSKRGEEIFYTVEQQAEFPGGQAEMMKWINENLRYPEEAAGAFGRVIVQFVVEKDGSIGDVTVVRSKEKHLDAEAVRVVKSMPKWTPGMNNGVVVRSYFTLPVKFSAPAEE